MKRRHVSCTTVAGRYSDEPAHHLGRGHERVVGAERLARVAGRARHRDAAPVRTLLTHDHRQPRTGGAGHLEAAGLGDHVVGHHRVALVVDEMARAPRCRAPPRRRPRGTRACPSARSRAAASRLNATAIDAVRFSMSTAPRPQISSSTRSPPNGARRPAVGVRGHDVGVAHQQQRRRVRIAALDARDEALAPGLRLVALEVEPRATEVLRERVDRTVLVPRLDVCRRSRTRCGSVW